MSGQTINPRVAAYVAEVANAVSGLLARDCGFGEFYIAGIKFGYEGEDTGIEIIPDEFGGLSIKVDGNPSA